ncbi:hypothetical protein ckin24_03870 [Helicobacter pylori]
MEHDNSLGGAFNKETGELNTDKLREHFKNLKGIKESKMNILLMGVLEWVKARSLTLYLVKKSLKQA